MLLSLIELAWQSIFLAYAANPNPFSPIIWVDHSLDYFNSSDPFSRVLSTDERIMESIILEEEPWEDAHQRSHLPYYNEDNPTKLYHPTIIDFLTNSIPIHAADSERNPSNIEETISIYICDFCQCHGCQ